MQSAVLTLSGGLDSAANLALGKDHFSFSLCLTFDYGQKSAVQEVKSAKQLSKLYGVEHKVVKLPFFFLFSKSALTTANTQPPSGSAVQVDNLIQSQQTAKAVWVPNRNGIFINIAAGFAESRDCSVVVTGFNLEEAATFPDNSEPYLDALTQSFSFSTSNRVQAVSLTSSVTKSQIVKKLKAVKFDFSLLWPCYLGDSTWCGQCESCLRFERACFENSLDFNQLREAANENFVD